MRRQVRLDSRQRRALLRASLSGALVAFAARAGEDGSHAVARGESLSRIAESYCTQRDRICVRSYVLAIYRANPAVFQGSPDHLKPGDKLRIPSAKTVAAIPRAEALAVYKSLRMDGALKANPDGPEKPRAAPMHHAAAVDMAKAPPPAPSTMAPEGVPESEAQPEQAPAALAAAAPLAELPATAPEADDPELRRIPGEPTRKPADESQPLPDPNRLTRLAPVAVPEPWKEYEKAPIPDRWRLLNNLGLVPQRWYDPYNQNTLKGDKPLKLIAGTGDEFLSLNAIADTLYEYRRLPTPVGLQGTSDAGSNGIFGGSRTALFNANIILSGVYIKGDTTFKPPEYEFHFTPVLNYNYTVDEENGTLRVNPSEGRHRADQFLGLQELFLDYHIRNVSDRYDFDSVRFGVQPFSTDFRGFLFQDNQLALRLFGTRDNNRWQYNLAWIRRLEKNTNSGLNDAFTRPRNDDIFVANVYRQDLPVPAFTSQLTVVHNRNRENGQPFYDDNGFKQRPASLGTGSPRKYEVSYLGYNGDGHFGRLNLTVSTYLAYGHQDRGVFNDKTTQLRGLFAATEASYDVDWLRLRASALYGSGDHNPYNGTATGFDAIFENPVFAGADTSFWIRQAVPLIGGGGVTLSQRNGVLDDLRSSKDFGQSNFENPGIALLGVGADADVLPQLRVSGNFNHLWFDSTQTLQLARNQGGISKDIGWDLSTALIYRPFFTQNIVFRLSGAMLVPGDGYRALFPDKFGYSVLGNLLLTY